MIVKPLRLPVENGQSLPPLDVPRAALDEALHGGCRFIDLPLEQVELPFGCERRHRWLARRTLGEHRPGLPDIAVAYVNEQESVTARQERRRTHDGAGSEHDGTARMT